MDWRPTWRGRGVITDACFIAAAEASADQIGPDLRAKGMLFPGQANILETEVTTATRAAEFMFDNGLAQVERPRDIRAWIPTRRRHFSARRPSVR